MDAIESEKQRIIRLYELALGDLAFESENDYPLLSKVLSPFRGFFASYARTLSKPDLDNLINGLVNYGNRSASSLLGVRPNPEQIKAVQEYRERTRHEIAHGGHFAVLMPKKLFTRTMKTELMNVVSSALIQAYGGTFRKGETGYEHTTDLGKWTVTTVYDTAGTIGPGLTSYSLIRREEVMGRVIEGLGGPIERLEVTDYVRWLGIYGTEWTVTQENFQEEIMSIIEVSLHFLDVISKSVQGLP